MEPRPDDEREHCYPVTTIAPMMRERLLAYAMATWHGYRPAAHHRLIASKLEAVERGEIRRLMIFLPPRHGKSALASEYFPAWYIGRNAEKQIIHCTYAQDFADDLGMKVRNQIADPMYQEIFPGVELDTSSRAAGKFNTTNGGVYRAVGAGGPITGRGAHCVVEGTLVMTAAGRVPIEALAMEGPPSMILTWNEQDQRHEFKPLQAIQSRRADGLYRITTAAGRVLEVTGNHRVYVAGQYRRADALAAGDRLLCLVRKGIRADSCGLSQGDKERAQGPLLQQGVLGGASRGEERQAVLNMRPADRAKRRMPECQILQEVSSEGDRSKNDLSGSGEGLSYLQYAVQSSVAGSADTEFCDVLQQEMFRDWPLQTNVGNGQPKVEARGNAATATTAFGQGVQANAQDHPGARQLSVRCLQDDGEKTARAPHRQLANEQRCIEPGDVVLHVSQEVAYGDGWQAEDDAVAMVDRLCETACVYDIQVADNHNFYAGDVLVHNCLLIDDPIKGREDADSETMRRKLKDWYGAVAYTRLMPESSVVIIQTRWHADDLSGWLLKEHRHENWDVLSLPAIDEYGNALWPEAYPLERLLTIRKALGERDWTALYQQQPTVDGGNILKRKWWRWWPDDKQLPKCDHVFLSWDTAYSDADMKGNAHSACTVWGVFWHEQEGRNCLLLLKTWHGMVDYPDLRKKAKELDRELEPDCHLIEKKASGQSLLQDLRRIPGVLVRVYNPDRDKVTRAYSVQAMLESGQVFAPNRRWAEALVDWVAQFPNGTPPSADFTDTVTQALLYLRNGWWLEHPDDKLTPPPEAVGADDEDGGRPRRRQLYG